MKASDFSRKNEDFVIVLRFFLSRQSSSGLYSRPKHSIFITIKKFKITIFWRWNADFPHPYTLKHLLWIPFHLNQVFFFHLSISFYCITEHRQSTTLLTVKVINIVKRPPCYVSPFHYVRSYSSKNRRRFVRNRVGLKFWWNKWTSLNLHTIIMNNLSLPKHLYVSVNTLSQFTDTIIKQNMGLRELMLNIRLKMKTEWV